MRDYSEYFRDLNFASTGIARADTRLRRFNLLRHEVTMPALMPLLGDCRSGEITADDFADTIELVDGYIFRRLVVGVPSNALNKIFATLYSDARRLRTEGPRSPTSSPTFCSVGPAHRAGSRQMKNSRRRFSPGTSSTSPPPTVAISLSVWKTPGRKTTGLSPPPLNAGT